MNTRQAYQTAWCASSIHHKCSFPDVCRCTCHKPPGDLRPVMRCATCLALHRGDDDNTLCDEFRPLRGPLKAVPRVR